jgi:hypothetical protein
MLRRRHISPYKPRHETANIFGLTPRKLRGGLTGILTLVVAALLLSRRELFFVGIVLAILAIGARLICIFKGYGYGRRALAFTVPFVLASAGFMVAAMVEPSGPALESPIELACKDIYPAVQEMGLAIRSASISGLPSPRYSGAEWASASADLSQFQERALQTGDAQLINAVITWKLDWGYLYNSLIQLSGRANPPVQGKYLSGALLAEIRALSRCDALGFPQARISTSGRDVCRALLNFANMLAHNSPSSKWATGAFRVVLAAEGNGPDYAPLKYEAAKFALLTMVGYLTTNGFLYPLAAQTFEPLRDECAQLGEALPPLPSIRNS